MRQQQAWQPSVFVQRGDTWTANPDPNAVAVTSRVQVSMAGRAYGRLLATAARGALLDLGCGNVPCYGMYRDRATSIVCTDWPNSVHANPHLDFASDLTRPLPLKDAIFDTVVMTDVLEHLPNPTRAFAEIGRVLRPGGRLILGVPFLYGLHEEPHDHHRYTGHQLRVLCAGEGLVVELLEPYAGGTPVVLDLSLKLLARRRRWAWLARPASFVARSVAGRATVDDRYPAGYVLVAEKRH